MAIRTLYDYFRQNIGDTNSAFTNGDIDSLYEEASEDYTDDALIRMQTVILGIDVLLSNASKLTEYRQNNTQEKQQDIFKHLLQLRDIWVKKLETAAMRSRSGVGMPKLGIYRKPKELPRKW